MLESAYTVVLLAKVAEWQVQRLRAHVVVYNSHTATGAGNKKVARQRLLNMLALV
jgi:hypothetical protein